MVVTLQLIATMRIFSQVYVMTNGGPAGSSSSVIYYIYQTAIVRNLMGYASAVSVLLFLAILMVTLLQRWLLRETARGRVGASRHRPRLAACRLDRRHGDGRCSGRARSCGWSAPR